jgi:hypothetical protein
MNNSWQHVTERNGVKVTTAFQAHENKLYVHKENANEKQLVELNKKMQIERPYGNRWAYVFSWPNTLAREMAYARFPECRDKDEDVRMSGFARMSLAYPDYVSQTKLKGPR